MGAHNSNIEPNLHALNCTCPECRAGCVGAAQTTHVMGPSWQQQQQQQQQYHLFISPELTSLACRSGCTWS